MVSSDPKSLCVADEHLHTPLPLSDSAFCFHVTPPMLKVLEHVQNTISEVVISRERSGGEVRGRISIDDLATELA